MRGASVALSGWTKFASLLVVPLWSGYPEARRGRDAARFILGFAVATALVFFVLFLEPSPLHAARVFYRSHRSLPGRPRLAVLDLGLGAVPRARASRACSSSSASSQVLLVLGALALGVWPAPPLAACAWRPSPPRVLIGFELVLTHWFVPLPAVVLPVRRDRADRAAARAVRPPNRHPSRAEPNRRCRACAGFRLTAVRSRRPRRWRSSSSPGGSCTAGSGRTAS